MTQEVDFGGLRIAFDDRVLRPRRWTEHQSRWAAELLPRLPNGDVLELCSGAGQIGLLALRGSRGHAQALRRALRQAQDGAQGAGRRLVCVDVNPVAADYTIRNAAAAGLADLLEMRTGRIDAVLAPDERFPMIIADPPWVPRAETTRFPEDPLLAIDGGDDGLGVVRECATAIAAHLTPGGVALLQLAPGDEQADGVAQLLAPTRLTAGERRHFDRGTLLRIDRPMDVTTR